MDEFLKEILKANKLMLHVIFYMAFMFLVGIVSLLLWTVK